MDLCVLSLNCGRKLGSPNAVLSLLDAVSSSKWDVLLLQEQGALHVENSPKVQKIVDAVKPHLYLRTYGGPGHTAQGCIVHHTLKRQVRKIQSNPRCTSLLLQDLGRKPLQLVGVHGYADGEHVSAPPATWL